MLNPNYTPSSDVTEPTPTTMPKKITGNATVHPYNYSLVLTGKFVAQSTKIVSKAV